MNVALLVILIVIQLLDVASTAYGLKLGASERMQLPAMLFDTLGFWPAVALMKGVLIALAAAATIYVSNAYWFTAPLNVWGACVLVNNWRVIRRRRAARDQ